MSPPSTPRDSHAHLAASTWGSRWLGGAAAAWLCGMVERGGLRAALIVLLGFAMVVEGYGGRVHLETFRVRQGQRAALHEWLGTQPGGAMLELPVAASGNK